MKNRRRYYLHRRLKGLVRIQAWRRIMYYQEGALNGMTDRRVKYFVELQMKFKYQAQLEI